MTVRGWRVGRVVAGGFAALIALATLGCQPPDPAAERARTKPAEPTVDEQLNSPNEAETRKGIDRAKQKWGAPESPKKDEPKASEKTDSSDKK